MSSSRFRFICVDEDRPPGFEHVPEPTRRDLRSGLVALWTLNPRELLEQLGPVRERIRGVLFTVGESQERVQLGPSLWQVEVSEGMVPQLRELATRWLEFFAEQLVWRDELERGKLHLERGRVDRQRLIEKVARETSGMRELLETRTLWTARAMTSLVQFAARELQRVETSQLPQTIVNYLCAEPFLLPGASMWLEREDKREGEWELLVERGASLKLELPAPQTLAGIVQLDATTLLCPIRAGAREAMLGVSRVGGFDEAGFSFLSLFSVQIAATYQAHELNTALSLALARKDALIEELSTPVIQVWHDTVCLPIVGSVDSERAEQMSSTLLEAVVRRRIRHVIIDFTGLGVMDTQTVHLFTGLARAISLVGAKCVLSGVSPQVARTLVTLGVEMLGMQALPSVEAAIASRVRAEQRGA